MNASVALIGSLIIVTFLCVRCSESDSHAKRESAALHSPMPVQQLPQPQQSWYPEPQPTYAPQPQQQPTVYVACPVCKGTGRKSVANYDQFVDCEYCNGKGTIIAGQGQRNRF